MSHKRLIVILSMLLSPAAGAFECDAHTMPRRFDLSGQEVSHEALDEEKGNYVVLFKNGDLLLAAFSTCGLGMHAHYYATAPLTKVEQTVRLRWMLAAVLPSRSIYEELEQQLVDSPSLKKGDIVSFGDEFESHDFVLSDSESPLFSSVIHYTWNPPQY